MSSDDDTKTPPAETARSQRHERAAHRHDDAAGRHGDAVEFWKGRDDDARADLSRRHVEHERRGSELERDVAQNERDDPL